jgi:ketosteroid isomerase-like protein
MQSLHEYYVACRVLRMTPERYSILMDQTNDAAAAADWVDRFSERWRDGADLDRLRDLMHPDTQNLIPPMHEPADREGVIALFKRSREQLPDLRLEVIRWASSGDTVFVEWAASATVAGRPVRWQGVDRVRLRDGRTYEGRVYWDTRRVAEMFAEAASGTK